MPRALIAEDEALLAAALRRQLAKLWPELELLADAADGPSALQAALASTPEVCFFDIRMPGLTGLEVAAALAEDWPEEPAFPLLVFVTAYDQYAVAAFEAQAVDYLVKPVRADRLAACIARLQARLAERSAMPAAAAAVGAPPPGLAQAVEQLRALLGGMAGVGGVAAAGGGAAPDAAAPLRLEVIQAQAGALVHLVPVDEVVYFEAADKYIRVITAEREHLIRMSLRELLPRLDPNAFWQVHRSLVVRAREITTARREDSGKVTLTLARRPEKLVASRLYAHLFKGL